MGDNFVRDLANATAHWLADQELSGFKSILSEALLLLPVGKFLLEHGYNLYVEQHSKRLFGFGDGGQINYDLYACGQPGHVLLEMKYLKKLNDQRLMKDLVKLALPPTKWRYQRMLLIARPTELHSSLVQQLGTSRTVQFKIDKNNTRLEPQIDNINLPPFSRDDQRHLQKWIGYVGDELTFSVSRCASTAEHSERVIILSVSRD